MQALVPEGGAAKPAFLRENAFRQGERRQLSHTGALGENRKISQMVQIFKAQQISFNYFVGNVPRMLS